MISTSCAEEATDSIRNFRNKIKEAAAQKYWDITNILETPKVVDMLSISPHERKMLQRATAISLDNCDKRYQKFLVEMQRRLQVESQLSDYIEDVCKWQIELCKLGEENDLKQQLVELQKWPQIGEQYFGSLPMQLSSDAMKVSKQLETTLQGFEDVFDIEKILTNPKNSVSFELALASLKKIGPYWYSFELGDVGKLIEISEISADKCELEQLEYLLAKAAEFVGRKMPISLYTQTCAFKQIDFCRTKSTAKATTVERLTKNLKTSTAKQVGEFLKHLNVVDFAAEAQTSGSNRLVCRSFKSVTEALRKFAAAKSGASGRGFYEFFGSKLVDSCFDVRQNFQQTKMDLIVSVGLASEESDKKWKLIGDVCNCVPGRVFEWPQINEAVSVDVGIVRNDDALNVVQAMRISLESAFDREKWSQVSGEQIKEAAFKVADLKEKFGKAVRNEKRGESVFVALKKVCSNDRSDLIWLAEYDFGLATTSTKNREWLSIARLCTIARNKQVDFNKFQEEWTATRASLLSKLKQKLSP